MQPVRVRRGRRIHWLDAGNNRWRGARDVLPDSASRCSGRRQRHRDGNAPVHRRHIRVFRLPCSDVRSYSNTDSNSNSYSDSYCNSDSNSNTHANSNCHTDSYSKRDTNCDGDTYCNASAYRDSNCDTNGNSNPNRNTDCYCYAYSKAYRNTEGSFYTAASRNTAAKTLTR